MVNPILVIGATGNVGAEVMRALREAGIPVRAAVRNKSTAEAQLGVDKGVELVSFDFQNPATFEATFNGVKRVFLVRPPAISNVRRDILPAIEAAKRAGVEHIVFLSLFGVEKNRLVPHYKIEQLLQKSGLAWTFLRCGFFMQNLNTTQREDIQTFNDLFVPAGRGKTSFIDVRDIGSVAAKTLSEAGHYNTAYDLTGREALDYYQIAEIFTAVLGRPFRYSKPSPIQFFLRWRSRRKPLSFILVMMLLYMSVALNRDGRIAPELPRLLGRPPITMRQYINDYKACWR